MPRTAVTRTAKRGSRPGVRPRDRPGTIGVVSIEPDNKDWTWVIEQSCGQCGFEPARVVREDLAELVHANTRGWYDVLAHPASAVRPAPPVGSPLRSACHVRDVHELFARRLRLMLDQDDPTFDNWDQDATAVEKAYDLQDPGEVGTELVERAAEVAAVYTAVEGDQWQRTGRRSNGSLFTVE